jgi:WD40 repeat protein
LSVAFGGIFKIMSASLKNLYAVAPFTSRGQAVHLGKDPKGKNILYTNGRSVIIRNLENPLIADQYTEHVANATVARYAPSGFYIASGDAFGNVRIWDTTQKEHPLKLEIKVIAGEIKDIAWDSESKRIIAVGNGQEKFGHAFLFDSGSSVGEISGHSKVVNSCDIKPSRPYRAVTVSDDLSANYYEGPPFKFKQSSRDHTRFINCVRFNPSGDLYVTVGADGKAFLYDGKTGDKTGQLGGDAAHGGTIFSCSWSDDGKSLLTCSADRTVKLWDVGTQTSTTTFEFGQAVEDQQVGVLWQGNFLVSLSLSGDLNYLDKASPSKPVKIVQGHSKPTMSVAAYGSNTFFSGDVSGRIYSWDVATGVATSVANSHTNQTSVLAVSGEHIVSAGLDDHVRISHASNLTQDGSFKSETQPKALASRNGTSILASADSLIVLDGHKKMFSLPIKYQAYSVAISTDGTEVAVGTDNDIELYTLSAHTLKEKKKLSGSRGQIISLAYSPNGNFLAAGDSQRQVIIYDVASGTVKNSDWVYHQAKVNSLAWSPSSLRVASGSLDTHIYVWSMEKPEKKIQIKNAHIGSVNSVAFLDENTILSVGQDGTAKTWTVNHH